MSDAITRSFTAKERFRYRLDDYMSRGPIAQMAMLAALSGMLIFGVALILFGFGLVPVGDGENPSRSRITCGDRRCARSIRELSAATSARGRSSSSS